MNDGRTQITIQTYGDADRIMSERQVSVYKNRVTNILTLTLVCKSLISYPQAENGK